MPQIVGSSKPQGASHDDGHLHRRAMLAGSAGQDRRGLTIQEAADHCGLSVSGFRLWVRRFGIQCRIHGTNRYDRVALNAAIDRLTRGEPVESASRSELERWLAQKK